MTKNGKEWLARLLLLVISTSVMLVVVEFGLRTVIFSEAFNVPALRQLWRYADNDTDDYWKIFAKLPTQQPAQTVGGIDPTLGWAPLASPDNPLGLVSDAPYAVDMKAPLIFFGDSFVAAATEPKYAIPQALDRLLADKTVYNYGVGGFGVDQIYMRFLEEVGKFEKPSVLIGILTQDLDRSILSIRTGQKPYFELEGDELVVKNLPILPSTREYVDANPPQVMSYLWRLVAMRVSAVAPAKVAEMLNPRMARRERSKKLNRRILRGFVDEAKRRDVDLKFVLFVPREDFARDDWREVALKGWFEELGVSYFDTKAFVQSHLDRTGEKLNDFYIVNNGHPNEKGNQLIAEGIAAWLGAVRAQ
ncbi:MAG: hypothetical protein K0U93_10900 [Gammaproteobacteria bacterium]|nr:hypothetical protein [Gammaproteobacteria bacterium]